MPMIGYLFGVALVFTVAAFGIMSIALAFEKARRR